MKRFVVIGAAGYIAPRHIKAIRDIGNEVVAVMDIDDPLPVIQKDLPFAAVFRCESSLRSFIASCKAAGAPIDYVVVCSPNHLHLHHVLLGLEAGCDVICEKPLTTDQEQCEIIRSAEIKSGKRTYTILQLRLHEEIIRFKKLLQHKRNQNNLMHVSLRCIMPRNESYYKSWKGDDDLSGGIMMNIGVHYFDLLLYLFGAPRAFNVSMLSPFKAMGQLALEHANVDWFLSTKYEDLHEGEQSKKEIRVNGDVISLNESASDLHTKSYKEMLSGKGCLSADVIPSIELIHRMRKTVSSDIHVYAEV
jgi:UDP-N-acetyl-2-amino-2-deoxyglucuronate dehydrogenase